MSELKPCPFCGGEAEYGIYFMSPGVKCTKCSSGIYCRPNRKSAISEWNRRAQPANDPLTLEQLRKMDNERVFVVLDDVCIPALVAFNTEDCSNEDEDDVVYLTNNLGGRSTYEKMLEMGAKFYRRPPERSENKNENDT